MFIEYRMLLNQTIADGPTTTNWIQLQAYTTGLPGAFIVDTTSKSQLTNGRVSYSAS